jgi:hypothetical protein
MAFVNAVALPAPNWLEQSSVYHAKSLRRLTRLVTGAKTGILSGGDFQVTATLPASMNVNVAKAGGLMVPAVDSTLGSYIAYQDAAQSQVAVPAADATYATQHLLCVQILDSDYSGTVLAGNLGIVAGTPAATPTDPTLPTDGLYVPLARIIMAARATAATNIVDLRQLIAIGGTPALAYVEVTTPQTGFAQTTWGDITGTSVSFVTPGGHRIRETVSVPVTKGSSDPTGQAAVSVWDTANTTEYWRTWVTVQQALNHTAHNSRIVNYAAGTYNFKLRIYSFNGFANTGAAPTAPVILSFEDLGP